MVVNDPIHNFLNDITTALPYSDYIRVNKGDYVIIDEKPYVIKGLRFRHIPDTITRADGYLIQCYVSLENVTKEAYFSVSLDRSQIVQLMDKPMVLIDLINAHVRQKLKFIAKNKTTDLLFKNEG